jgi:uncharacterized membrane protein YfcA
MTVLEALAITGAGAVAGGVNTVVGSGSLITFPTLLAVGYAPVTANVSNTIGLVPGGVSGSIGYRAELRGQGRRTSIMGIGTTIGAVIGGVLLLTLPTSVFDAVVPALILLAVALMAIRPSPKQHEDGNNMVGGVASSFFVGIYGGYFGAAQGIILMSLLRLCFSEHLQVLNAIKNVLAGIANLGAGVRFMFFAPHVAWGAAALIAVGSTGGAQVGARYGRRLPEEMLRRIVIVYGTIVAAILIIT